MPEQIDNSINYIEFPLTNVAATKAFYGKVFGWTFTDWGPDYISFEGAQVAGGFNALKMLNLKRLASWSSFTLKISMRNLLK